MAKDYPQGDAFLTMLLAAMDDAAINGKLTQLQTQLVPTGQSKLKVVRLIVIPEDMALTWPSAAPAGSPRG